jgi:6-pyruvoyltetrahydropterin/6-carboxytetrahydropterin synthase
MHVLARQIRFAIDPLGNSEFTGANSYAGKPATQGFGLYGALWVHLKSKVNRDTGFVVNVSEIDAEVRRHVLPLLSRRIREICAKRGIPDLSDVYDWLEQSRTLLAGRFTKKSLCRLELELNPFRKAAVAWEKQKMLTYTEQFEFAAMHKLWNSRFDERANITMFGKCANPAGHGHNYILAVTVRPPTGKTAWLENFQKTVQSRFLCLMDHKNLNRDVKTFAKINPTVENIAQYAWKKLDGKFKFCKLVEITVWENDRTWCRYHKD